MMQISPSVLNSFQALHDPDSPWMTEQKFRDQLLNPYEASPAADAGNAVHEATFEHDLEARLRPIKDVDPTAFEFARVCEQLPIVNSDGNMWLVADDLIAAARAKVIGLGTGLAEVPRLLTEEELGVPGVQMSMRCDYLTRPMAFELKTSGRVKALRYIKSAQSLAYRVAYKIPLRMILAQVKVSHPRGRPEGVKGLVTLEHCQHYDIDPSSDDLPELQKLIVRCLTYLRTDEAMIDHVSRKHAPVML